MNRNNQSTTEGNYLRIVVGLNKRFNERHSIEVTFSHDANKSAIVKKETLFVERVIYVLCKTERDADKLKNDLEALPDIWKHESQINNSDDSKRKKEFTIGMDLDKTRDKSDARRDEIQKIIDPDTLANLGNCVKFSTADNEGYVFTINVAVINPPEWVPIENGKWLCMQGKGSVLEIRVVDRRLGEIVYRAGSVKITGSDLRVYGDQIRFDNGNVIKIGAKSKWEGAWPILKRIFKTGWGKVCVFFGGDKDDDAESSDVATAPSKKAEGGAEASPEPKESKNGKEPLPPHEIPSQLEVKGNGIGIKDVRTSDVERVIIRSRKRIRAAVESTQQVKAKKRKTISFGDWLGWWVILLVAEVLIVAALTALPFWKFIPIRDKYLEELQGVDTTNEVVVANSAYTPSVVTNTLSMQTSCSNVMSQSAPTNCIDTIATSISSASGSPSLEGGKRQGTVGITLYFVLSCFLYVVFYAMFVCFTFLTLRALRRKRKLTADMSGVLEALRNERDKDKRKAMQKKILDDMINTYLDKPSAED